MPQERNTSNHTLNFNDITFSTFNYINRKKYKKQKRGRTQRESNEKMVRRMKYESQKEKLDI